VKLDEETPLPPEKSCIAVCHTYSGLPSGITAKYAIAHPLWDGCVYMSRFNQVRDLPQDQKVNDGFFMRPDNASHSFYREFTTEETHSMFEGIGFERKKSLSERGTDQIYLYGRGSATFP
jgi:hypothetical protein